VRRTDDYSVTTNASESCKTVTNDETIVAGHDHKCVTVTTSETHWFTYWIRWWPEAT
jgi:hypothetical protein